jgi:oligopeptide/dipeptide ABC transporter ATP-binding protein
LDGAGDHLLQIQGLSVTYSQENGQRVRALAGINLAIAPGEVVGILGESGCGKSTLANAVLGLLPRPASVESGEILFEGVNLSTLSGAQLQPIRGSKISMVPQEPALSLNPVLTVGTQIAEVLRAHLPLNGDERRKRVSELLREVGFDQPAQISGAYAHQLSGGQRQRVVLAQAIACQPLLLIADEPTSKLDASLRTDIAELLSAMHRKHGMAILLISHDVPFVASLSDRIALMYAGSIVEIGLRAEILRRPLHPYTQGLLRLARASMVAVPGARRHFATISVPALDARSSGIGCRFEAHCSERMGVCGERVPREVKQGPARSVTCFKYDE